MGAAPVLLTGGTLIDGSGAPRKPGDLLLAEGKIVQMGTFPQPPDAQPIDCTGRIVCPGFIDAHSHSDLQVLTERPEKVLQGVTAEVVGNCGFSPYPMSSNRHELHQFANGI